MQYIIGTEKFNKNLDAWLAKNNQTNAEFLRKNKNHIPQMFRQYTGLLYRGMTVDEDFIYNVNKNDIKFTNNTSWTKDKKIAEKFINDKSFKVNSKTNKYKIIISKRILPKDQILDIESFVMFMGIPQLEMQGIDELSLDSALKEKEVLISSGIKILKQEIKQIE
jgi:hypothetical protein